MLSKCAGAVAVAIVALCGTGFVADGAALSRSHTLLLRPGVGIGPIRIGETLAVLRQQSPDVVVRADGNRYSVKIDGATIQVGLSADRVVGVFGTSAVLVLGTRRLQNHQASEPQALVRAGWKRSSCPWQAHSGLPARRQDAADNRDRLAERRPGLSRGCLATPTYVDPMRKHGHLDELTDGHSSRLRATDQ